MDGMRARNSKRSSIKREKARSGPVRELITGNDGGLTAIIGPCEQAGQRAQIVKDQYVNGGWMAAGNKSLMKFVCKCIGDREQPGHRLSAGAHPKAAPIGQGKQPISQHMTAFFNELIRPGEIRQGSGWPGRKCKNEDHHQEGWAPSPQQFLEFQHGRDCTPAVRGSAF